MNVPEIDVGELAGALAAGAMLIDVREPDEHEEVRVPQAQLIPLATIPDRAGELPVDQTFYVICKAGGRSAKAVEHLRARGLDAVNVAGGTTAWVQSGLPCDRGPGGSA